MPLTAMDVSDRVRWPSPAIPPLAGFFAKDEILQIANSSGRPWVYGRGSVGALLTALYMAALRLPHVLRAPRCEAAEQAHESPPS